MADIIPTDLTPHRNLFAEDPQEMPGVTVDVTSFFRNPEIWEALRTKIVPDLIAKHPSGQILRLWVAGCSTGEEAYSLGMILQECITEIRCDVRMQIFASDTDEKAVSFASDGFYPPSIKEDMSPERLQRFFTLEEHGYRVTPELRTSIIFAVQNALIDPPSSSIDFISCRNLLIDLGSEAKAKIIERCSLVLGENGILLFGNTAAPTTTADRVDGIDKSARTFRSDALGCDYAATRAELQAAIRELENEVDNRTQITAKLLSPDEKSQSLNAELTAHNIQLSEALERQRATANDLENVLYSTDVATILLDSGLNIRYFTPAAYSIFHILRGDIGRPLADLNARVPDPTLLGDASAILTGSSAKEREIRTGNGTWYMRRVMPYHSPEGGTEGIVITFTDVTTQHRAHEALERAKRSAERANAAKSRFLATASHDLRQPLQSLALLQGLLEKTVEGEKAQRLINSFRDTLSSMSEMLNALLDINQIESGTVCPRIVTCKVNDVLQRLSDEFSYIALEKGLFLRFVPCSLLVRTDPRLLEQIARNLLANAIKYTREGRILLGCRRHKDALTIEVWDSGVGIAAHELQAIFDEYHQADGSGAETEAGLGLGLGLSIVNRLSTLLGHQIQVRSTPGRGSVFSIHVALGRQDPHEDRTPAVKHFEAAPARHGTILVIEDDRKIRNLIEIALRDEQHVVYAVSSGATAIELISRRGVVPTLVLADYNLPNKTNGMDVARDVRATLGRNIPAIILTGDITAETLRILSAEDCLHMPKPVRLGDLLKAIQLMLHAGSMEPEGKRPQPQTPLSTDPTIFIVDDDHSIRETLKETFVANGNPVLAFSDGETFLTAFDNASPSCLVMDVKLPGINGLDVLRTLRGRGDRLPVVVITGAGDVAMAVMAMKAGASDFIEKPVGPSELLASVSKALERSRNTGVQDTRQREAKTRLAQLTERQREILDRVLAGQASKVIAQDLHLSQRTVEVHRAAIMRRMQVGSLPALARLVVLAGSGEVEDQG